MSRIIKLRSENILCLKAISIVPDGSMVKITGANDAGKTANLRCIWMALGGKKEIPADAIRDGQDKGYVQLDIGDNGTVECTARLNLRRRENGTIADSITLKDAKGRTVSSPMTMIADMLGFGRGQFDPLAFRDAKPEAQVDMLKTALGLDFAELDSEYSDQYDERTIVNRQAKELVPKIGEADPDVPAKREDIAVLANEHTHALALAEQNHQRERAIDDWTTDIKTAEAAVESKISELQAAKDTLNLLHKDLQEAEEVTIQEVPDTNVILQRMKNAESINERVRVHEVRRDNCKEWNDLRARSETITECLATIKATRDKMIADAEFPIPGVVIEDKQILVGGHPLANLGGAAQLRFGVLLVMMSDPKLRIITMDEALGKLDDESLEMLDVLLAEHNFQAWITGPRAVGEGCIEIRDGEIVDG